MTIRSMPFAALSGLAMASSGPSVSHAQASSSLSVAGGVSQFDLSGTGTVAMAAIRGDRRLGRPLIGEIGVGFFQPKEGGRYRSYLIPELMVQADVGMGALRPYVGAGIGQVMAVAGPDPRRWDPTASAALGARVTPASQPFALRAELRVRGVGSKFQGAAAEWTLGGSVPF